jgi:hypothetical protein
MKSINIKRIAAVAAGVAMVGSVMASGLAVTQQGEVTSLVSSIKANLDNAQVVVGTHGADISDGVQAAKIAAVLASVNYAAVSTGTVSIKDKQVVLETSAGATEQITSSNYPVELVALAAGIGGKYATTAGQDLTLTKDTLTAILSQKQLSATVNGTSSTYLYEDRILLNKVNALYDESSSSAFAGHGLYLNASYGTGGIEYRVFFSNGLPVGTGRSYATIPEIDFLGHTAGVDYATAQNQSMYIYSGTKSTMMTGDEVSTADSYKVRLDSVTQGSANTYYAIYTATNPSGATETSSQLTTAGDYNFFANKVSVHVDYVGYDQSAAKGTTITRVTAGKQLLTDGAAFALDNAWTVKHVDVSGGTSAGTLNYIALKYGSVSLPPTFAGTVQTGLAQGTVIDGPKMADGTPKYQMKLKGFGSTSSIIDTTTVDLTGIGSMTTGNVAGATHLLQTTWTARDGSIQKIDATLPSYVVIPASGASAASFNTNINARWMIVNDKVVYLKTVEPTGTGTQYNVKFALGGVTGQEVIVGPFANASFSTATFTYTSNVNPISCTVTLGHPEGLDLTNVTLTASGSATSSTDTSTGACDVYPDVVPVGIATQMTSATGTPYLDLRFIQGNVSGNSNPFDFNESATSTKWFPLMRIVGPSLTENVTIVYDSEAGTDGLTGMRAYRNFNENLTTGQFMNFAATKLVDQGSSTVVYEDYLYHVTPFSIELNGAVKGALSTIIPEARRNAILEISSTIGNATGGTGTYTATEGQTVGNVKVKTISCTASVTGSNLYSPTKTVQPESLIATDASASASYQIVVGGPWVNSVAQGIAGNALTTSAAGASYLIADGNKLLVAGFTAADTASAADALVGLLKA